jgi:carbon-monoxide dehydrogenase small subunit
VRDLVSRVGESFAQNLDARLSAPEGAEIAPARLSAASLIFRVAAGRVHAAVVKILGRQS